MACLRCVLHEKMHATPMDLEVYSFTLANMPDERFSTHSLTFSFNDIVIK